MVTGLFYHEAFLKHDAGFGHPERPERLSAVMDFFHTQKVFESDQVQLLTPRAATMEELQRVHPQHYIELIQTGSEHESQFDADTRASRGSYEAALLAAGAGIHAWEKIQEGTLSNAFALVRPPGHHANATSARGFCLFNNISITARHITATVPDSRVFILDVDAHHGNGTQEIHYNEPTILYLGFHQDGRTLYPGYSGYTDELGEGPGKGFNINFPLPPGTTDKSYLKALRTLFPVIAHEFQPTAILVSIGYDGHFRDYLTGLQFSATGFFKTAQLVMEVAQEVCAGRVIMFLEGGYDLQGLSESIYNTVAAMSGSQEPIKEKPPTEEPRIATYINKLLDVTKKGLSQWWQFP